MAAKKTNPKKIPRTQADVDKAFDRGADFGCEFTLVMMLLVLKDKHNAPDDEIMQLRKEFEAMLSSYREKYMSYADAKRALFGDYNLEVSLK